MMRSRWKLLFAGGPVPKEGSDAISTVWNGRKIVQRLRNGFVQGQAIAEVGVDVVGNRLGGKAGSPKHGCAMDHFRVTRNQRTVSPEVCFAHDRQVVASRVSGIESLGGRGSPLFSFFAALVEAAFR